jgi:hypothetical protein
MDIWDILLVLLCVVLIVLLFIRRSKIEFGGGKDKISMQKAISALTQTVRSQELISEYGRLFEKYCTTDMQLPPVVTFDDISESLNYEPGMKLFRSSTHIGERKLFLTEVQFCTEYIGDKPAVVIYAGAAPNNKGAYLASLLPKITWVFIDPNPFDILDTERYGVKIVVLKAQSDDLGSIDYDFATKMVDTIRNGSRADYKSSGRIIYIINDYMTVTLAKAFAGIPHYFISDIRTNVNDMTVNKKAEDTYKLIAKKEQEAPDAIDIIWNLSQHYNWVTNMHPIMAMFKFRHPFYNEPDAMFYQKMQLPPRVEDIELSRALGLDFIDNYRNGKKLIYFAGTIYVQAWAGVSSTESRLVTDCKSLIDYGDCKEYENRYCYYNNIERPFALHVNPNTNKKFGFDHCGDCSLENHIWEQYIAIFGGKRKVISYVAELSHITGRRLVRHNHGGLFHPIPPMNLYIAANMKVTTLKASETLWLGRIF